MTHAANPVTLHLAGSRYRVYFASRDERNRSHVAYLDFDVTRPEEPVQLCEQPALAPGPLGYFDDHGVYPSSIVREGARILLYYTGWNPGPPPIFYASAGLAESFDGGRTFRRVSAAPILGRDEVDPWMVSQPVVRRQGSHWDMWYISGLRWERSGEALHSFYHIKHASSRDGVAWSRNGHVAIELEGRERNIARACVVGAPGSYRAWFATAGDEGYRVAYAESHDGLLWRRRPEAVPLEPGPEAWENAAITYPWVFQHADRWFMLYNGNLNGREGMGLAEGVLDGRGSTA